MPNIITVLKHKQVTLARQTYLANGMLSLSPYASYKYSLQRDT